MTTKTVEQSASDEELDQIFETVMTCEPALTLDQSERFADSIADQEQFGRKWRLTAVLANKGGVFFRDLSKDQSMAQALAPTVGTLTDFAQFLRSAADLADSAACRVMVAGCAHEHFNEWAAATDAQS